MAYVPRSCSTFGSKVSSSGACIARSQEGEQQSRVVCLQLQCWIWTGHQRIGYWSSDFELVSPYRRLLTQVWPATAWGAS